MMMMRLHSFHSIFLPCSSRTHSRWLVVYKRGDFCSSLPVIRCLCSFAHRFIVFAEGMLELSLHYYFSLLKVQILDALVHFLAMRIDAIAIDDCCVGVGQWQCITNTRRWYSVCILNAANSEIHCAADFQIPTGTLAGHHTSSGQVRT